MNQREQVLRRIAETVRPEEGRIPAFIYTDPDVYQLELERIFQQAWLFVAHESEIAQAGDYVTRQMGEQSVIVSRGEDLRVRVLLNVCRHRGMRIARVDVGNSAHFRCPYHGFTYTSSGELTGVPFQRDAYIEGLCKEEMGLVQARTESYRGMVFATWNTDGPSLEEYLGDLRWYLDILVGRAEMEVVGPAQRWVVPASWKLPSENFATDAYHTASTHASIARLDLGPTPDFGRSGYHITAGNGHGLGLGTQDERTPYPEELMPEFQRNLTPAQFALLNRLKNLHGNVFPNCSFLIPTAIRVDGRFAWTTTLRLWQPLGPSKMEVSSWCLVEKNAPEWWKKLSTRSYVQTFGSSGIFEQDDTENWESQTRNFSSVLPRGDELYMNYSMGIGREPMADFPGPGTVFQGKFSENNARSFYETWLRYMGAEAEVPAGVFR